MLLVVDSGNTNVVFALFEGRTMRGKWRASTDPRRTPDEYAVWLAQLMALQGFQLKDVTGAIISNVVPAATYGLANFIRRYCAAEPVMAVGSEISGPTRRPSIFLARWAQGSPAASNRSDQSTRCSGPTG